MKSSVQYICTFINILKCQMNWMLSLWTRPNTILRVVIRAVALVRVFAPLALSICHRSVSKWKTKSAVAAFWWKYWGLCLSVVPTWLQGHALPGRWRVETPSNLSIPLTTLSTTRLGWKLPEWDTLKVFDQHKFDCCPVNPWWENQPGCSQRIPIKCPPSYQTTLLL